MTAACLEFAAVVYSPLAALTWTSAGLSVLSGERPGVLSVAGMVLAAPAIVAVAVSAARMDAAQPDRSDSAAASAAGVPGTDEDARTSVVNRHWADVFWGLAAGAGFAMFLIGLNRAGSSQDLWPVGIADLAGVITTVGVAAVAGQLALPAAGTRRLSLLTGIIGAVGALSVFLATHRGLLARHGSDLLPLPGRDDHLGSGAIR
jgi:hypothetical protein